MKNYSIEKDLIKFQLKDETAIDPDSRLNKLLFLLRPTWYKARKKFIILEYYDNQNNPIFRIEVDTSKNEDIFTLNIDENLLTFENIKESCKILDLRK